MRARFVILANGILTTPKLARIEGMETYQGESFHTSRWNYDVDLEGKRIGIIGTGATAVQAIPELAKVAGELYVFQRTPSTIDVRDQRETTEEERETWASEPGWARARRARFSKISAGRTAIQANDDYLAGKIADFKERKVHERRLSPEELMEKQLDSQLPDHGADPGPRRRHHRGPRDGGGAQAVLPVRLQAADVPRRVPADVQPAPRPPRRHRADRRHRDQRARRRPRRHGVPARRADLRDRLPVDGDVDVQHGRRPRRPGAQREVADRGHQDVPRPAQPGLPQPVHRHRPAGRRRQLQLHRRHRHPRRLRRVDAVGDARPGRADRRRRRRSRRRPTPSTAGWPTSPPPRCATASRTTTATATPRRAASPTTAAANWHKWRIKAQETMEPYVFGHATV